MHLIPFESRSLQFYSPSQQNADLRFHLHESIEFMQKWLFLPIHKLEALRLYKQVPILFYKDHQDKLAMAALLYNQLGHVVKGPKQCALNYLPVTFRLYPFSWLDQDSTSKIAIYGDAPHFQGTGERLFTSKNKPTQRMRSILQHIGMARSEFLKTKTLFEQLEEKVVFKPFLLNKVEQGQRQQIGFLMVDTDQSDIQSLSPELQDLVRAHTLSLRLIQIQNQSEPVSTDKDDQEQENSDHNTISADQLIEQVCEQFGVTEEDLLSRKRAEVIASARKAVAVKAADLEGMYEELGKRLNRSVATIKRWSV